MADDAGQARGRPPEQAHINEQEQAGERGQQPAVERQGGQEQPLPPEQGVREPAHELDVVVDGRLQGHQAAGVHPHRLAGRQVPHDDRAAAVGEAQAPHRHEGGRLVARGGAALLGGSGAGGHERLGTSV